MKKRTKYGLFIIAVFAIGVYFIARKRRVKMQTVAPVKIKEDSEDELIEIEERHPIDFLPPEDIIKDMPLGDNTEERPSIDLFLPDEIN
jgi:hypothetical protein